MSKGRGSAVVFLAALVVAVVVLSHLQAAEAATYTVGGRGGWTFNVVGWPRGKRFRAGDTLVFRYNPAVHNVVKVDGRGYNSCSTPRGAKTLRSGRDMVRLVKGRNYFICSIPGHCQSAMKIAVTAF